MRKGLGLGKGKGYKNIIPNYDSYIHSLSAKGIRTYKFYRGGKFDKPSEFDVKVKLSKYRYWVEVAKQLHKIANQRFKKKVPIVVTKGVSPPKWRVSEHGNLIGYFISEEQAKKRGLSNEVDVDVSKLYFKPITDEIWEQLKIEGLTEEFSNQKKDWRFAILPISKFDKEGLKKFDENIVNKFANWDYDIKEKYNMKYIDLINYKKGEIIVLRRK
jgi:hypothetical protein